MSPLLPWRRSLPACAYKCRYRAKVGRDIQKNNAVLHENRTTFPNAGRGGDSEAGAVENIVGEGRDRSEVRAGFRSNRCALRLFGVQMPAISASGTLEFRLFSDHAAVPITS